METGAFIQTGAGCHGINSEANTKQCRGDTRLRHKRSVSFVFRRLNGGNLTASEFILWPLVLRRFPSSAALPRSYFRIGTRTRVMDCGGSVKDGFQANAGNAAILVGLSAATRHIFTGPDGVSPCRVSGAVTVAFAILLTNISVRLPVRLSVAA